VTRSERETRRIAAGRGARPRSAWAAATIVGAIGWLAWPEAAGAVGPVGTLVVDCTGIQGWAQEPDMPDAFIEVHLYFGGPAGDPAATAVVVSAGQMIATGCMGVECVHGYRSGLPMSLLDEVERPVHAYGIDLTGDPNLELTGSPAVMSCPPPPIVSGELRHVTSPEVLTAWQFSLFFDRLVVPDATITGLVVGPVVDMGPQLRVDAFGDLWVIDQGRRREVPSDVAVAWRLAPAAAVELMPLELAMPEGTPLRPRPVLVQGAALPEVYLLDDHQCVEGDPDPSCVPEGEDESGGGEGESGDADTGGGADTSGGADEGSGEGSGSGGTAGVVTGLPPIEDDEDAAGCGCRGSDGPNGPWALVLLAAAAARRRRPGSR
jgi:MYXO-CTERM domain-containing protein